MPRLLIFYAFILFSCQGHVNNSESTDKPLGKIDTDTANHNIDTDTFDKLDSTKASIQSPQRLDVLLEKDIQFNGKLSRFFTQTEFDQVFGKPDSIKFLKDETPCVTIFDTEGPEDKYLYKNGSRFETSGDRVAVEEYWFQNGNFIIYKGIRIDANTDTKTIQQLFPNSYREKQVMDQDGKHWTIQFMEDENGISDGHIRMLFENNKPQYLYWWFPC